MLVEERGKVISHISKSIHSWKDWQTLFYFPVVLTSTIRAALAETTVNTGMAGAAIEGNKELMENVVNTIRTTVAGKRALP